MVVESGFSDWRTCGKTIRQLIRELQTFENQDLEVRISSSGVAQTFPISMVMKSGGDCVLAYFPPAVDDAASG